MFVLLGVPISSVHNSRMSYDRRQLTEHFMLILLGMFISSAVRSIDWFRLATVDTMKYYEI